MIIDKQTVEKVAGLARIKVEEAEVGTLVEEMNKILTFMEKLNELDTDEVEPLVYMNEEVNVWREDEVKQEIITVDGLKNAALHNDQYFMVPKIIEK